MPASERQTQEEQKAICIRYAAEFFPMRDEEFCGFGKSTKGQLPINGLRHQATGNTTGWYIWCGEQFSNDADFFVPQCIRHIYQEHPEIAKYLGLPPGFRFLLAGDHVDVWYDESLGNA